MGESHFCNPEVVGSKPSLSIFLCAVCGLFDVSPSLVPKKNVLNMATNCTRVAAKEEARGRDVVGQGGTPHRSATVAVADNRCSLFTETGHYLFSQREHVYLHSSGAITRLPPLDKP